MKSNRILILLFFCLITDRHVSLIAPPEANSDTNYLIKQSEILTKSKSDDAALMQEKESAQNKDLVTAESIDKMNKKNEELQAKVRMKTSNLTLNDDSYSLQSKQLHVDETLEEIEFDMLKSFNEQIKEIGKLNPDFKSFSGTTLSTFPDTISDNERIENLPKASRTTMKKMFHQLQDLNVKWNHGSMSEISFKDTSVQLSSDKKAFVTEFVKLQLGNVFGYDRFVIHPDLSGDNKVDLLDSVKEKLINDIVKTCPELFERYLKDPETLQSRPKTDAERLQDVAKVNDLIMNELAQGTGVCYATTIDGDGTYTCKIAHNENGLSSESKFDNDGNLIERTLCCDAHTKFVTNFTDFNPKTKMIINNGKPTTLSIDDAAMISRLWKAFDVISTCKCTLKLILWSAKQVAINIPTMHIAMTVQAIMFISYIAIVKLPTSGWHALTGRGYSFSDPTISFTLLVPLEIFCGDSRGLLSADSSRVFKKGSRLSYAANAVNPWGHPSSQRESIDPDEEYYTWIKVIEKELKSSFYATFPDTFGYRLVDRTILKNDQATTQTAIQAKIEKESNAKLQAFYAKKQADVKAQENVDLFNEL